MHVENVESDKKYGGVKGQIFKYAITKSGVYIFNEIMHADRGNTDMKHIKQDLVWRPGYRPLDGLKLVMPFKLTVVFFFLLFKLKILASLTVYANLLTTISKFNNQSFLQSMQLIILYNNLCKVIIAFLKDNCWLIWSWLVKERVTTVEGFLN